MKCLPTTFLCAFLLSTLLFSACGKNETGKNANLPANQTGNFANENKIPPQDDVEELERIIKLPFHPEEAIWRETVLETPQDGKKLTVVLKFSTEEANKIVEQAEQYKSITDVEVDAEDWFPAELIAQSQISGDVNLKGKSYNANDFFQSPFSNGKITRINNTDYFVLELTSF